MSSSARLPLSFLSLPHEIRLVIYDLTTGDSPTFNTYDQNPPLHNLLLVNRQIHEEFAQVYYASKIFHLYMRRRGHDDSHTPDTSGLAQWRTCSPLMLSCIREVMIHVDVFFRSVIPVGDGDPPSNLRWLAAGLARATNVEVLHIVLFCAQPTPDTSRPLLYLSAVNSPDKLTVGKQVLKVLPWIKECCDARTLPYLLRVVLHVDPKHGNDTVSSFMEHVEGWEWAACLSRSFVSCENQEYTGYRAHYAEHQFGIS